MAQGDPYDNYDVPNNNRLPLAIPIDDRRSPKEQVLGIPVDGGGLETPFGELEDQTGYT